ARWVPTAGGGLSAHVCGSAGVVQRRRLVLGLLGPPAVAGGFRVSGVPGVPVLVDRQGPVDGQGMRETHLGHRWNDLPPHTPAAEDLVCCSVVRDLPEERGQRAVPAARPGIAFV